MYTFVENLFFYPQNMVTAICIYEEKSKILLKLNVYTTTVHV